MLSFMNLNAQVFAGKVPEDTSLAKLVYRLFVVKKNIQGKAGDKVVVSQGTTFLTKYKGGQYLLSAKHLFTKMGYQSGDVVEMQIEDSDRRFPLNAPVYFFPLDNHSDMAVIKLKYNAPNNFGYDLETKWDLKGEHQGIMYIGFPTSKDSKTPEIRHGKYLYLDQTNPPNPMCVYETEAEEGFSGSPVFMYNEGDKKYLISSIISAGRDDSPNKTYGALIAAAAAIIDSLISK